MINFLDLTVRRFGGGASHNTQAGELKRRASVLISSGILIALWLAAGIAFWALIFIAMFL